MTARTTCFRCSSSHSALQRRQPSEVSEERGQPDHRVTSRSPRCRRSIATASPGPHDHNDNALDQAPWVDAVEGACRDDLYSRYGRRRADTDTSRIMIMVTMIHRARTNSTLALPRPTPTDTPSCPNRPEPPALHCFRHRTLSSHQGADTCQPQLFYTY